MSFIEPTSLCNLNEYRRGQEKRVHETDLILDDVYMIMVALKTSEVSKGAAKVPSSVQSVDKKDNGLFEVKFQFLDDDFRPIFAAEGEFNDGYWLDADDLAICGLEAATAYFKNYKGGLDDQWLAVSGQIDSKELVGI